MLITIHNIYTLYNKKVLTPSAAWLSISRRPPDESYRGVTVSVGGLGAAQKIHTCIHITQAERKFDCVYSQKFTYV